MLLTFKLQDFKLRSEFWRVALALSQMTSLILDPFADVAMPPAILGILKAKGIDVTDLEFASLSTAAGASDTDSG